MRTTAFVIAAVGGIAAAACQADGPTATNTSFQGSLANCAAGTAVFTTLPVEASLISGWVPLGNLGPPAHTLPTDHQYIYLRNFGQSGATPAPLHSPGAVSVLRATVSRYSAGSVSEDYSIYFSPCAQVSARFGHVRTIAPELLVRLGPFDQNCNTYSPNPGLTITACSTKNVNVPLAAGDAMGTTAGLDLWLYDARVPAHLAANPARWQVNQDKFDFFHVVPFSDYFAEPVRTGVQALLGSYDGSVKRTVAPLGGTIAYDVPGTLQGTWFNPAQPTNPEYWHMAFVPDNVNPDRMNLSMGLSQAGFLANLYYVTPTAGGEVNRHPAQVTPGVQIWCYDFQNQYGMALLQLSDATTLRFEGRNGQSRTCAGERPWAFTSAAITFRR